MTRRQRIGINDNKHSNNNNNNILFEHQQRELKCSEVITDDDNNNNNGIYEIKKEQDDTILCCDLRLSSSRILRTTKPINNKQQQHHNNNRSCRLYYYVIVLLFCGIASFTPLLFNVNNNSIRIIYVNQSSYLHPLLFFSNNNNKEIQRNHRRRRRRHPLVAIVDSTIQPSLFIQKMSSSSRGGRNVVSVLEPLLFDDNGNNDFSPDYGGLDIIFPTSNSTTTTATTNKLYVRNISYKDYKRYEKHRYYLYKYMEKHTLLSKEKYDPYDDIDFNNVECVRPKWTYEIYQTCNNIHDITYFDRITYDNNHNNKQQQQYYDIKYLGHGAFRISFLLTPTTQQSKQPSIVIKNQIYTRDLDRRDVHKVNVEALIMEKLTSSTRTSNIYGHCGTSIIVEKGYEISNSIIPYTTPYSTHRGRINEKTYNNLLNTRDDVYSLNKLSLEEKLDIAIAMAESLAEMHGYVGGVMTNDDISLGQWLTNNNGNVILNDFNDAMYMEWNIRNNQGYCKYWRAFGGTYKAPEEYYGDYLDESVDIWPMGNILYSLLTGLYPYYYLYNDNDIQEATRQSPPIVHTKFYNHTYIENNMINIMKQCHKINATERIDIFTVVQYLRETKKRI